MVHRYQMGGLNIALDVNSGCVHVVDEIAYEMIGLYETTPPDEIVSRMLARFGDRPDVTEEELREVLSDLDELKADGKLFAEDTYRSIADSFKRRQSVIKALCLHVAHDCNLSCTYCFAGKGEYHGPKGLMSFEVGKRALDFLIEHSGTRRNLEVDFFGGEPLMNFDVVKKLVAYGREQEKTHDKHFRFTLTTNGVLLDDEVAEFANREMSNVVLSLDGRKEVHDRMRSACNGKGSYDLIVPKFKKLADSRGQKDYYIRGTFTHYNTDFAEDILHIADLGFKEISLEPVVAPPDAPYALTEADLPELLRQYDRLTEAMKERDEKGEGFTFFHFMIDLTGGPCIVKRVSGCGVGTEYMAVTPEGDLYPCHQFVGEEAFRLGNVFDGITNEALRDQFKACNIYSHKECDDCFARFYCSGGCVANAYHSTGSIHGVYALGCEMHRKRIECAIYLQAVRWARENGDKS